MSITLKRMLTMALVATSVGAVLLPRETIARDAYHHYGPRVVHGYLPPSAYGAVAPALAHDCRCYDTRAIRSYAPRVVRSGNAVGDWGYPPLRNASPQDPSGTIVLEGAAGAGAPNGD